VATVVLVALGILLGNWQVRRVEEKTALQARLAQRSAMAPLVLDGAPVDPAAVEYRHVVVTGEFIPNWPLYVGRTLDGRAGVIVLMPFTIAGSSKVVLVARGWAPRDPGAQDRVPAVVAAPAGRTTVEGLAVPHLPRVMTLGTEAPMRPGAVLQNLDTAAFARVSGMDVLPVLVEQTGADAPAAAAAPPAAALVRKWSAPGEGADRNRGYVFQWYALAAMAFLFFVITGFRSGTKQAG